MADTHETIADIIAEMHRFAKQHEYDHPDMDTNACGIEDYAYRLEAAHEREVAQFQHELDGLAHDYNDAQRARSMANSKVAQLRETLGEIVLLTLKVGMSMNAAVATGIIASKAKHALAATETKGEKQ